jgi:hypothetical protein
MIKPIDLVRNAPNERARKCGVAIAEYGVRLAVSYQAATA